MTTESSPDALSELTTPGVLRVGINLGNSLLVTAAIAERLGAGVSYVTFATPGEVADAGERDAWDIALIAVEPKRAEKIAFSEAYVEIEATYLVPANSPLQTFEDVDQPGVRIAVADRAAYDLYLTRTLKHAQLQRGQGLSGAFEMFASDKLDALAGLVPALRENAESLPGSRLLAGCYTSVRQAIGTKPNNVALKAVVEQFVSEAKETGAVAGLIEKHGVAGRLQVASDS